MRLQLSLNAPGLWLLLSIICAVLLLAMGQQIAPRYTRWAHLTRWLLIPYLGLLLGSVSPRLMGLTMINWPLTFGLGLSMTFVILVLLVLVRSTVESHAPPADEERFAIVPLTVAGEGSTGQMAPNQIVTHWIQIVQMTMMAGAEEFHWAFLRGGLGEMLMSIPAPPDNPAYAAVWVAILLAVPDLLLRRSHLPHRLLHVATLLTTSILFFYTRNFWLCWAVHAAIWLIIQPQERPTRRSAFAVMDDPRIP